MRPVSCAILTLMAVPLFAADVYRSIDAQGNVVYSDRPDGQATELVRVVTNSSASSTRQPIAARAAAPAPTSLASEDLNGEVRQERPPAEVAAERERNCAMAQERADRYRVSQRLYRTLPNGEREYLSDAELDEARAKAEADVTNWCS